MTRVDSKGRIVLPQAVRERLGITPGTEVVVHEEGGKAVVEPEDDTEGIIDDLEALIADAAATRESTPYDELDAESRAHVDTIQRQTTDQNARDE